MERIKQREYHQSMRGYFAGELYNRMIDNPDIWVVSIDLGYGMLDKIRDKFPDRFINTGAAEQSALGISVGLAKEGKRPFVYTISSFYLRAAETIALYLKEEQNPVTMVGGGRDDDYKHDGISHYGMNAQDYMKMLGIKSFYPRSKNQIASVTKEILELDEPVFLSLRR